MSDEKNVSRDGWLDHNRNNEASSSVVKEVGLHQQSELLFHARHTCLMAQLIGKVPEVRTGMFFL